MKKENPNPIWKIDLALFLDLLQLITERTHWYKFKRRYCCLVQNCAPNYIWCYHTMIVEKGVSGRVCVYVCGLHRFAIQTFTHFFPGFIDLWGSGNRWWSGRTLFRFEVGYYLCLQSVCNKFTCFMLIMRKYCKKMSTSNAAKKIVHCKQKYKKKSMLTMHKQLCLPNKFFETSGLNLWHSQEKYKFYNF